MVAAAVALSRLALSFDEKGTIELITTMFWFGAPDIESSRMILSTISGAMITTASLVSSLTLVSLTLASQQLGPRLLTMFLRDRMAQVVLGLFLSTFVFSLIVLMALGSITSQGSIPILSMTVAIGATISSFVALIAFIHHLAVSLQADVVVARVSNELRQQIDNHFPIESNSEELKHSPLSPPVGGSTIHVKQGGYIQLLDYETMMDIAVRHRLEIQILRRPGHFLSAGESIAIVTPKHVNPDEFADELLATIVFGEKRTPAQDPEFALMAIVEIALRALSPGVNDPHTAITCIDRLSEALVLICSRNLNAGVKFSRKSSAKLFTDTLTIDGLLDTAFNEIRQVSSGNVAVNIRLAEALHRLALSASTPQQAAAIGRHSDLIERASERHISERQDLDAVNTLLRQVQVALHRVKERQSPELV